MKTISLPEQKFLNTLGFDGIDYELISILLKILNDEKLIVVEDYWQKSFDYSEFIDILLSSMETRRHLVSLLNSNSNPVEYLIDKINNNLFVSNSFKNKLFFLLIYCYESKIFDCTTYATIELYLSMYIKNIDYNFITSLDSFVYYMKLRFTNKIIDNLFSTLLNLSLLERSGWVVNNLNASHKESISEHMYEAWLLGKIYLPDKLHNNNVYNKNEILEMLLIHDIAESITGDIVHPKKNQHDAEIEKLTGFSIGTAIKLENLYGFASFTQLWKNWFDNQNINAQIAHDLDLLQMLYKLKYYHFNYAFLSKEELHTWFLRKPITEIGNDIYNRLIKGEQ